MRKSPLLLFSFILTLTTIFESGCSTTKITTNKSPDFNEKLTSVFVVIKCAKSTIKFAGNFETYFKKELLQKGVKSQMYIIDPLSLDGERDITERISKFDPQVLMTMSQTEVQSVGSKHLGGGVFDVRINLPGADKTVWRASLEFTINNTIEFNAMKTAKDLIRKMSEDKLF